MTEKDYLRGLGKRIRTLRMERGMTNMKLSHKTELDLSAISQIQLGRKNSKILTLKRIAEALDVDISELI